MLRSRQLRKPTSAALIGGLLMMPFLAANVIVSQRVEPFFSLIRPGLHTSAFEYLLLAVVLGCIPIGAFIAARPLIERGLDGKRRVYLFNALVAAGMLGLFLVLATALGVEIYRCDLVGLPDCD